MLISLHIDNIVLIEQAAVSFTSGWNILTGETGSGKSAITEALLLALGARADSRLVRKGALCGTVLAEFLLPSGSPAYKLLDDAGIGFEKNAPLIIKRELTVEGKGRVFINNQPAQLGILKQIGEHLAEIVGQHANHSLRDSDTHRELLDLFGSVEYGAYRSAWREQVNIEKKLDALKKSEAERQREIDRLLSELEELEHASVRQGEEEELFAEYTLLSNAEERASLADAAASALSLADLRREQKTLEALAAKDASLKEAAANYGSALLELEEIVYTLERYRSGIENNPMRQEEVNARLTLISRLKRKYGEDLEAYEKEAAEKLSCLEDADHNIESLEKALKEARASADRYAKLLTEERRKAAGVLEKALCKELKSLNMNNAVFSVQFAKKARDENGDETVEFFIAPNIGENAIPLKSSASGGELARVMLALKVLLTQKAKIPTLIFDEVDANIGGETAAIVGKKLKEIGKTQQVISITHFPQAAKQADRHIRISKEEIGGRTLTIVSTLEGREREAELERMRGESVLV